MDGLQGNKGSRIRCVRSLIEQIKKDHEELNRLWKQRERGLGEESNEEEIGRVLSWLRQEIGLYKELGNIGIERISLGEIEEIEKDVKDKEKAMMKVIYKYQLRGLSPKVIIGKAYGCKTATGCCTDFLSSQT